MTPVLFELHEEVIAFPRRYLPEGTMEAIYSNDEPQRQLPATSQPPQSIPTSLHGA